MARFCDSNQKRGLTLVELIVVLVILAVLAALLVPSLTGYIDKAVEKARHAPGSLPHDRRPGDN